MAVCGDLILLNYGKIAAAVADHLRFSLLAGTILGKIARTCQGVLVGSCSLQSSDHLPWSSRLPTFSAVESDGKKLLVSTANCWTAFGVNNKDILCNIT